MTPHQSVYNAFLVPTFLGHFYFSPYIFILPLLAHKLKKKHSILVLTVSPLTKIADVAN